MELTLSTPAGTTITPTPVGPDTTEFHRKQDAMRAEANGETAPSEPAAPPKRAEAPTANPKRTRKVPAERSRTTTTAKAAPSASPEAEADYSDGARALVSNVWLGLAMLPPTQPYAFVLDTQADAIAGALAAGAKQSETVRKWVTGGSDSMWKLQLALAVSGAAMSCVQLARNPELRELARQATRDQLGKHLAALGVEVPGAPAAEAATA